MALGDTYAIRHEYYVSESYCSTTLFAVEVQACLEANRCYSLAKTYWTTPGAVWKLCVSGDVRTSRIAVYQVKGTNIAPPGFFYTTVAAAGGRPTGTLPASAHFQFRLKPDGTNTRRTPLLKFAGVSAADVDGDVVDNDHYENKLVPFATVLAGALSAIPPLTGAWDFAARTTSPKNGASKQNPIYLPISSCQPSETIYGLVSRTSNRKGFYQATGD